MYSTSIEDLAHLMSQDDGSVPSFEERQALVDFLDQKITVEQAAQSYTRVVDRSDKKYPDPDDLWSFVTDIAQRFPETQERLLDLLKAITQLPPRVREGEVPAHQHDWKYWSELPGFHMQMRDYYDGQWDHSRQDAETRSLLPNLVKFTAGLWRYNFNDYKTWAVYNLQETLENDHEGNVEIFDAYVSSSVQWILQNGRDVYRHSRDSEWPEPGQLLAKARETAPVSRWDFWKARLGDLADREDLKESTKESAKKAVTIMEDVKKNANY